MLEEAQVREIILSIYQARKLGNKDDVARYWAPGATFRLAGDHDQLGSFPGGPVEAQAAIAALIDRFTFHEMTSLSMLIDGNRVAAHWKVLLSAANLEPFETEIADFWRLDDQGRITELVEFADTASIARLAARGIV